MPSISANASTGHQRCVGGGEDRRAAIATGRSAASRDSIASPQRVGHDSILARKRRAAYFAPASVSAAGNAHCAETPASASVRVSSVSAGTVESRVEHDPAVGRLEAVLGDEPREQRVVLEAAHEAGRADHLLAPVERRLDAEPPLGRGHGQRLVPVCRPADTTERAALRSLAARSPGREAVEVGEAAAREVLARHVQRPPQRLAPPHRDDLGPPPSAFSHSVAAARPAPTTVTVGRVLVRLVRVDRARVAAQLVRHVQARMPEREQHVPEDAVAVELEAAVDRPHALDAPAPEAFVPAAPLAQLARRRRGTRRRVGW